MLDAALLAVAAFASTNVDGLLLLVGLLAGRERPRGAVLAGQGLGMAALTLAALACSALAAAIPAHFVRWLGVAPIAIGAWHLRKGREAPNEAPVAPGTVASAAGVVIANGGDNVAVYTPLFSGEPAPAIATICAVFAAMTALWCVAALWLVDHPKFGAPIRRGGARALPFVLIALGLVILTRR